MKRISVKLLAHPIHFFSLGLGSGYMPKAPGTMGTVVGVVLYLILYKLAWFYYLALVILLFLIGIWICGVTARELQVHDHPSIVWDEIVGYLVTMIFAPAGWWWILLGFVLFRLFDIFKPWPINLLDKHIKGGLGIMIDDLIAGIFSLTLLQLIAYILYR
ncbi:MAG: phosphatidylglycerophosphatase A family protein [Gammaproteobacteria bacterium]|jgi:phosphatidylglycerophosphatase A